MGRAHEIRVPPETFLALWSTRRHALVWPQSLYEKDRFRANDVVCVAEAAEGVDASGARPTGRSLIMLATDVDAQDEGLKEGHIVLSLKLLARLDGT